MSLWPVVFYGRGIDLAIRSLGGMSVLVIAAMIVALNITLEYWVAVRCFALPRTRKVLGAVAVANLLSFVLVVMLVPTWFKM
jgi:uncharacterized membrane protein YadS